MGEGIIQAFLNDIEWRLNIVRFRYDCMNCQILEQDASIFGSIPYPIYRRLFKGLESIRVQEYLKFKGRADILAMCHIQSSPNNQAIQTDPEKLTECLSKICKEDFILEEFLKERIRVFKYDLHYDINCNLDDLECFTQYIKINVEIDPFDAEFLNTINKTRLNQEFFDRGLCATECTTLEDLQRSFSIQLFLVNVLKFFLHIPKILIGFYHLLSPGHYLLGTVLFACRKEIFNILCQGVDKLYLYHLGKRAKGTNRVLVRLAPSAMRTTSLLQAPLTLPGIERKRQAEVRKIPEVRNKYQRSFIDIDSVLNEFEKKAGMSLAGMVLRMLAPLDLSILFDMTTHTKNYVKKELTIASKERDLSRTRFLKAKLFIKFVAKGSAESLKEIGWRYCAGPIYVGFKKMCKGFKQGFQKKGVFNAINKGTEAMATYVMPGGDALLSAQKDLMNISEKISSQGGFNFEPCNPAPVLTQYYSNRRTSIVPGSAVYEARSLVGDMRDISLADLRRLGTKIYFK